MTDRLVDLQNHLIGRKYDIHCAGWAIRGEEQLECFRRHTRRCLAEMTVLKHFHASLTTVPTPSKGAGLGFSASIGSGAEHWNKVGEYLVYAPSIRGDIQ